MARGTSLFPRGKESLEFIVPGECNTRPGRVNCRSAHLDYGARAAYLRSPDERAAFANGRGGRTLPPDLFPGTPRHPPMLSRIEWNRRDLLAVAALLLGSVLLVCLPPARMVLFRGDMSYFSALEYAIREAGANGQWPLWNPYFSEPLLANPQAMVLYPPAALLRFMDTPAYFATLAVFHIWIAALGLYLLSRFLGFSRPAALAGAGTVAFSTLVYIRLVIGHCAQLPVMGWSVFTFLFFARLLHFRRFGDFLLTLAATLLVVLSGHTQYSLTALLPAGTYLFFYAATVRKGVTGAVGVTVLLGIFSAGLAALQILPTLEYFPLTTRDAGFTFEAAAEYGLSPGLAFNLLAPFATFEAFGATASAQETLFHTTVLLPGLALVAWRHAPAARRPLLRYALALATVALILALGRHTPVFHWMHDLLPFFRTPGRFLLLWLLPAAFVVAAGVEALASQPRAGTRALPAAWILAGGVLSALAGHMMLWERRGCAPYLWSITVTGVVLAAWGVLLVLRGRLPHARWTRLLVGLLVLDAALHSMFAAGWPAYGKIYSNQEQAVADMKALAGRIDNREVRLARSDQFDSGYRGNTVENLRAAAAAGIPVLVDYSANLAVVRDLFSLGPAGDRLLGGSWYAPMGPLSAPTRWEVADASGPWPLYRDRDRLPRVYGVGRMILADDSRKASLAAVAREAFDPRREAVVSMQKNLPPPAPLTGGEVDCTADITRFTPGEIVITAHSSGPALLVLAETFYPGWRAFVNDAETPVYRANHALRGVRIGAGNSTIRLVFEPSSVHSGLRVSLVFAALLGVLGVFRFRLGFRSVNAALPACAPAGR
jgi:hypothetical protein